MVLTIGYSDFYYKSTSLGKFYDATVIVHEYGIGHIFFDVIMYGYMIVQILILINSYKKKHTISRKNLGAVLMLSAINSFLFIVVGSISADFEISPLMYVFDGFILLYLNKRIMMYNIDDCVVSSLENQEVYGYIIFDNKKNYMGCNDIAKKIVPKLSECKIDYPVETIEGLQMLTLWIDNFVKNDANGFDYKTYDKHYQSNIRRLWHNKKACGYIVELEEDTDRWNYMNLLADYNEELENKVKEKTEHITNIQAKVLVGMADMVENRDDNTGGHIKRTSDVIRILIETIQNNNLLSLDEQFCKDVIKAAPMHDLGKIGIGDKILRKPGRLTDEEFEIMKTHAANSAILVNNILGGVEEEHFVKVAINLARHHHEKWNGMGYPDGLKGDAIPLEARIMAIADVYDALVSKRCYKEAMSFEKAYEVMLESMGSHFDPKLKDVFLLSRESLEAYYSSI